MAMKFYRTCHNAGLLYVTINYNYGTIFIGSALRSQISYRYKYGWFGYDKKKKVIGIKLSTIQNGFSNKFVRHFACKRAMRYFNLPKSGTVRKRATYSKKTKTVYVYLNDKETKKTA
jgi:hypothetical protein